MEAVGSNPTSQTMKKIVQQCPKNPAGFHKDILVGNQYFCSLCGIDRGTKAPDSVIKGLNIRLKK